MLFDPVDPSVARLSIRGAQRPKGSRRPGVALVLAIAQLVLAIGTSDGAAAHNNRVAFSGAFGPFDVVATVRYVHNEQTRGVLLDIAVRADATSEAVEDAQLEVSATAPGHEIGPLEVEVYGNTYRVLLPDDNVESWEVTVRIVAVAGSTTFTESVPGDLELRGGVRSVTTGESKSGASRVVLIVVAGGACVAVGSGLHLTRRRRGSVVGGATG